MVKDVINGWDRKNDKLVILDPRGTLTLALKQCGICRAKLVAQTVAHCKITFTVAN